MSAVRKEQVCRSLKKPVKWSAPLEWSTPITICEPCPEDKRQTRMKLVGCCKGRSPSGCGAPRRKRKPKSISVPRERRSPFYPSEPLKKRTPPSACVPNNECPPSVHCEPCRWRNPYGFSEPWEFSKPIIEGVPSKIVTRVSQVYRIA